MKKIFTIASIFSIGVIFAQEESADTTRFRVGEMEFIIMKFGETLTF